MKKRVSIFALLLCLVMLMTACGGGQASPSADVSAENTAPAEVPEAKEDVVGVTEAGGFVRKTEEGTLTIGDLNAVGGFNTASDNNLHYFNLVYDKLFELNPDTGEIETQLVDTWEYVDDLTMTFKLRDNVYFSNGDKLTAEDVLWSFQRLNEHPGMKQWIAYFDLDKCTVDSELEFTLTTYEPFGPGIKLFVWAPMHILNKDYVEANPETAFWDGVCGSGPYTVKEIVSGSHVTFARRDDYWGELPEAETITIRYYAESSVMFMDFENGALDAVFQIDAADLARLENGEVSDVTYFAKTSNEIYTLNLCEYVPEFQDVRVRQAVAHAIDVDAVAEAALGGLALKATSSLPSGCDYHIDVGSYEYDPELAKQLLSEAGYPDGFEIHIATFQRPLNQRIVDTVQYYLSEVGITLNVEMGDPPTIAPKFQVGETDIVIRDTAGGSTVGEPLQIYCGIMSNTTNLAAKISDPVLDGYLMDGIHSLDDAVREENYKAAQQYIFDNCFLIPICELQVAYAYRNYISYNADNLIMPNLRWVHFVEA